MKKIYFIIIVFLLTSLISVSSNTKNKVLINVNLSMDETKLKVSDEPHYKISLFNLENKTIKSDLLIKVFSPTEKEINYEDRTIILSPFENITLIQEELKYNEGQYGVISLKESGNYKIKVMSNDKNLIFYKCEKPRNLFTSNISKFCETEYTFHPDVYEYPFTVSSKQEVNFWDLFDKFKKGIEESIEKSTEIAIEAKDIAYWSFIVALLVFLFSLFNQKNILVIKLRNSFIYEDFDKHVYPILLKIINPLIKNSKRKRRVFYSMIIWMFISLLLNFDLIDRLSILSIISLILLVIYAFFLIYLIPIIISTILAFRFYPHSDTLFFFWSFFGSYFVFIILIYIMDLIGYLKKKV